MDTTNCLVGETFDSELDYLNSKITPEEQAEISAYINGLLPLDLATNTIENAVNDARLRVRTRTVCRILGLDYDDENWQFAQSVMDAINPAWRGYDPFSSQIGEMAA